MKSDRFWKGQYIFRVENGVKLKGVFGQSDFKFHPLDSPTNIFYYFYVLAICTIGNFLLNWTYFPRLMGFYAPSMFTATYLPGGDYLSSCLVHEKLKHTTTPITQ